MLIMNNLQDDHEVADNTYRDGSSELNNTEASFVTDGGVAVDQRKMNAVRAYFEWMPIRQVEMDDNLRIWRSFSLGSLLDLVMLDTRQYDRSITDLYWNTHYVHEISNDAGRSSKQRPALKVSFPLFVKFRGVPYRALFGCILRFVSFYSRLT